MRVKMTKNLADIIDMDMKKNLLAVVMFLITVAIISSCSGDLNVTDDTETTYSVQATLVKNLADGTAQIDIVLSKNGSLYKNAAITLAGYQVDTSLNGYSQTFTPGQIATGSSNTLTITDSASLDVNYTITLPGTLSIDMSDLPENRHYSGGAVPVEWTISSGTDGYILATTTPLGSSTEDGYEIYLSGFANAIPADGFIFNQQTIVGTHLVYVASYIGSPINTLAIPFEIPVANNPDDNITTTTISGRISGMVISAPDSVVVPGS